MKPIQRLTILALAFAGTLMSVAAQDDASGVVRRRDRSRDAQKQQDGTVVTERMQNFYNDANSSVSDADRQWMRVIYRSIDLDKDKNAPLYFPEEPIEGQENLFRIMMRLLASNTIPAYEYLDGREVFTDAYRVKMRDVLDRFSIPFTDAKGSTEKNPKFNIDENDVPTNEVLSYFVVERWEYDTRTNRLRPYVEAICPVLHRSGDFGGDDLKFPMFWVKFKDLRPYLAAQTIFVDDDNNLPTCTYDDFFTLNMYDGDIYKTKNLKNKSMAQLYANEDDLKRARDSIQNRLDSFEKKLWVPSREEVIAAREARESAQSGKDVKEVAGAEEGKDTDVVKEPEKEKQPRTSRSTKRSTTKQKKVKERKPKASSSSSNATRSVRRRK